MSVNNNLFEPGEDFVPYIDIRNYPAPPTPSTVDISLSPTPSPPPSPKKRPTTRLKTGTIVKKDYSATAFARVTMPPKRSTAAATSSAAQKPVANTANKRKAPAKAAAVDAEATKSNTGKSGRGRPKTTTPAVASKVTKGTSATASKAVSTTSRKTPAAKKAPTNSTVSGPKKAATKASASRKRKAAETEEEEEEEEEARAPRPTKKVRTPKARKALQEKAVINQAPTEILNVFVFGEGSAGELGLGTAKNAIDVKRPRLNPFLSALDVGVVQISCGGMHVVALTHDNRILTWGVNDDGALGRDTAWEGGLRDADREDEDSDDEDSGLNPKEATPTAIPSSSFPKDSVFTHVAASDSCTFAVTNEGLVYGWGTFRNSEGILGFSADSKIQKSPTLLSDLSKITTVVCGSNSAFALDVNGKAYCWGANPQSQLGYRSIERHHYTSIVPTPLRMGRKKIRYIACGNDHSFAVDDKDQVWAWGLNGHGQTGTRIHREGADANVVRIPTKVPSLTREDDRVIQIAGGGFHTVAITEKGSCLTFGRCDNNQLGIDPSTLADENVAFNDSGNRAAQLVPLPVPNVTGAQFAAAGTDHNIVINGNDEAFSWGFSTNYQTGQGHGDDVLAPTKLENTAVRGKRITWAGCGGQYSIVAGPAEDEEMTDG